MAGEGAALGADDDAAALTRLDLLRRTVTAVFTPHDLVFTPSAAALPWPAAEAYPPTIDGLPVGPRGHAVYTAWVNAVGLPAIALPFGLSRAGLPMGGQFVGGPGQDAAVLTFAAAFERGRPEGLPWPVLALA